jgi:uncharacterized protein (DUF362 family)
VSVAGAIVALKPNLGWDKLVPGAISAPWVVEGVIRTLRDHVAELHLVESDQVVVDAERAFALSRLAPVCRAYGVEWHNMSREPHVRLRNPAYRVFPDVEIPEILTRAELVTLPVMKTHNKTTLTGALKNQWGCLPALRHHYHLVLADALAELNTLLKPRFAVMDATVGLEGNGPKSGRPKEMGLVLASADLVGMDATAARLMGFEPGRIEHLVRCAASGLGAVEGSPLRGEPLHAHRTTFVPARHNPVSWLELALRRSAVQRLVFRTPLLKVMCWGARRYYDLWDATSGRRLRRAFFASSPWAEQWAPSSKQGGATA